MKTYTFNDIRKNGLLLYEYIRGSQTYGTNTPTSDEDHGGVYLEPSEQLLGLGLDFQDEIKNESHDDLWFSLKKYLNLLLNSNPNVLESLFIDDKYVIYEHPIITEIKKHRQEFVTKACFNSFIGYSVTQIKRAKGYNKKCNWTQKERLNLIEFCYVPYNQGSRPVSEWLSEKGFKQKYCGLVALNFMPNCYGVYYDFGAHIINEGYSLNHLNHCLDEVYLSDSGIPVNDDQCFALELYDYLYPNGEHDGVISEEDFNNLTPFGYKGIVKESETETPDDVRCSSIPKGEKQFITMTCNKDGYSHNCKEYEEWVEWNNKKNNDRYQANLGYNYDAKNMMHSFRLLAMGIEIAKTGKVKVNRRGLDNEFLLDIRNHKYTYDYLINRLTDMKAEMDTAMENSTLPEKIDVDIINNLLISIRRKFQFPYTKIVYVPLWKRIVKKIKNYLRK